MSTDAEIIPGLIALISSLIAMIMLLKVVPVIGGSIGRMIKMMVAGIFFSVFLHAGVELAAGFGLISEGPLMIIMGILITAGAVAFISAGSIGIKSLK
ncbi:MAG: hypothetical protein HY753_03055 [Nitrospirae bacterium]|nr:hypothetical protein [Nitrospirota bacterium]